MCTKNDDKKYVLTPFAIWSCIMIPFINNFIIINFNNSKIYYILSILIFFISIIFILKKTNIHSYITSQVKIEIFCIFIILVFTIASYFISSNVNLFKYLYKYLFLLSITFLVINERNIFYKKVERNYYYKKVKYNIPILFYVVINIVGVFLQSVNSSIYNKYILGSYYELAYGYRFGSIRYSGMFCWPNLFAYSTGAIYLLTYTLNLSGWIRLLLLLLIVLSKVRTVLIAIITIEIINIIFVNKKLFFKNIKKITLFMIFAVVMGSYYANNFINSIFIATSSYNYRLDTIITSLKFLFSKNYLTILFGTGLGRFSFNNISINNYDSYLNGYFNNLQTILGTSDTFFTVIGEVGLVGTILIIILVISLFNKMNISGKLLIIYLLIISYSTSSPISYYGSYLAVMLIIVQGLLEKSLKMKETNNHEKLSHNGLG